MNASGGGEGAPGLLTAIDDGTMVPGKSSETAWPRTKSRKASSSRNQLTEGRSNAGMFWR